MSLSWSQSNGYYLISSNDHFSSFRNAGHPILLEINKPTNFSTSKFKLTTNISLDRSNYYITYDFKGELDGNNYKISISNTILADQTWINDISGLYSKVISYSGDTSLDCSALVNSTTIYPSIKIPTLKFTQDFTIEFFLYPTSPLLTVLSISNGNILNTDMIMISGNKLYQINGTTVNQLIHTSTYNIFSWNHVALSYSQSNNKIFFAINGVTVSNIYGTIPIADKQPINLLFRPDGLGHFSRGCIDNFRVSQSCIYNTINYNIPLITDVNGWIVGGNTLFAEKFELSNTTSNIVNSYYWNIPVENLKSNDNYFSNNGSLKVTTLSQTIYNTYPSLTMNTLTFSADFTIEFFIYPTSSQILMCVSDKNVVNADMFFVYTNVLYIFNGTNATTLTVGTITNNSWNHIAISYKATTTTMYFGVNGIVSSVVKPVPINGIKPINFMFRADYNGQYSTGYIDSIRISQSCIYTSNYTTPTTSTISSWTNTGNTLYIENFNIPSTSTEIWNIDTTNYKTSAFSYQGGSSLGITILPQTATTYPIVTVPSLSFSGSFTIEMFVYPTSVNTLIGISNAKVLDNDDIIYSNTTLYQARGSTLNALNGGSTITTNNWQHIAICFDATTNRIYRAAKGTVVSAIYGTVTITGSKPIFLFGRQDSNSYYSTGYVDCIRVSQSCLYTGTYTVPTVSDVASWSVGGSTLYVENFNLVNQSNPTNYGGLWNIDVVNVPTSLQTYTGNSSLDVSSTIQNSFYSYPSLLIPSLSLFKSFTIEMFIYTTNNTNIPIFALSNEKNLNNILLITGTSLYQYNNGAGYSIGATASVVANTWNHCAVSFDSNTNKTYLAINGIVGSGTYGPFTISPYKFINILWRDDNNQFCAGYADNIRISQSCLYSTNYTKPTTNDVSNWSVGGTTLFVENFKAPIITAVSNPTVINRGGGTWNIDLSSLKTSTVSYSGGKSIDVTSLSQTSSTYPSLTIPNFSFNQNFTIELFIYPTTANTPIISFSDAKISNTDVVFLYGNVLYQCIGSNVNGIGVTNPTLNTWNHVALSYNAGTNRLYVGVNGTITSVIYGDITVRGTKPINIYYRDDAGAYGRGYFSNLRVSQDVLYTKNYTVPTSTDVSYWTVGGKTLFYDDFKTSIIITPGNTVNTTSATTNTGAILATVVSGGSGTYTSYIWTSSTGATTITTQDLSAKNNLLSGTYTLTVTDNAGVNASYSYIITDPLLISYTKTDSTLGNNGSITLNVSGGSATKSYIWNININNAFSTSQNLNNIGVGTYTCTVTSGIYVETIVVIINGNTYIPTIGGGTWTNYSKTARTSYSGTKSLNVVGLTQSSTTYPSVIVPSLSYSNSFTIEMFYYAVSYGGSIIMSSNANITNTDYFLLQNNTLYQARGTNNIGLTNTTGFITNSWNHVAISYDSTTNRIYNAINGTVVSMLNGTITVNGIKPICLLWRSDYPVALYSTGYIDNMRVSNTCIYTNNYTVPAPEIVALWSLGGSTIFYDNFEDSLTNKGEWGIDISNSKTTTQSYCGGRSLDVTNFTQSFGNYPYLMVPSLSFLKDYTVEFFVYPITALGTIDLFGISNTFGTGSNMLFIYINNLYYYLNGAGTAITNISTLSINAWNHVAVSYNAATTTVYLAINGTVILDIKQPFASSNTTKTIHFLHRPDNAGQFPKGYIDCVRASQECLYKNSYIVPTASTILSTWGVSGNTLFFEDFSTITITPGAVTNVLTYGASNGLINTSNVSGGSGIYTYSWVSSTGSTLITTQDLSAKNNLLPGSYTLIVTDSQNISASYIYDIGQPLVITSTKANSTNGLDGYILLTVVGGFNNKTKQYNWFKDSNTVISTNKNLIGIDSGKYSCVITSGTYTEIVNITIIGYSLNSVVYTTGGGTWNFNNDNLRTTARSYTGTKSLDITSLAQTYTTYPSVTVPTLSYSKSFTIEFFTYLTSYPSTIFMVTNNPSILDVSMFLAFSTNTLYISTGGGRPGFNNNNTSIPSNSWTHVAVCYDASTLLLYYAIQGTVASFQCSSPMSITGVKPITFLGRTDYPQYSTGYIDNVRVSQSCLYTTSYTIPTSAQIANWKLGGTTLFIDNFEQNYQANIVSSSTSSYSGTITPGSIINATSYNSATGSIGVTTITGGTGSYVSYIWTSSTGATTITTQDLTAKNNLSAGLYTLTVTDTRAYTTIYTYTILQPTSISSTVVNSTNGIDGSIILNVLGGAKNKNYSWTRNGNKYSISQNIGNIDAGTYVCTITDGTYTDTTTVTATGTVKTNNEFNFIFNSYNTISRNTLGVTVTSTGIISVPSILLTKLYANSLQLTNNSSQYVTITNIPTTTPWTYEFWAFNNINDTNYRQIVRHNVNNNQGPAMTNSSIYFHGDNFNTVTWNLFISSYNSWHHYAFVNDGTTFKGYQDGQLLGSCVSNLVTMGNTLDIGLSRSGISGFQGYINDFIFTSSVKYSNNFVPKTLIGIIPISNITNVSSYGLSNGSIGSITLSGGTNSYINYEWSISSGATALTTTDLTAKTNLKPGIYSLTITDSSNYIETYDFNIGQPILLSITKTDSTNGSNGVINLTPLGGLGGPGTYSYSWVSQNIVVATTQNLINIIPGIYTCTVTSGIFTSSISTIINDLSTSVLLTQALFDGSLTTNGSLNLSFANSSTTLGGTAVYSTGPKTGTQALVFTTNKYLDLQYNSKLDFSYNTPFSLGGWFYVTATNTDIMMSNMSSSYITGFEIYTWNSGTIINFKNRNYGNQTYYTDTTTTTVLNTWIHWWVTYNGSTYNLYKNGILFKSFSITDTNQLSFNSGVSWQVARNRAGSYFTGRMSDIRWYSGVKSPLEVMTRLIINSTITNTSTNSSTDGSVSVTVSGGSGTYTYNWSKTNTTYTATTANISNLDYGEYILIATDTDGTKASSICYVAYPMNITSTNTNSTPTNGGSIILSITGGSPNKTYSWTLNSIVISTNKDLINIGAGTYICTITSGSLSSTFTSTISGTSKNGIWSYNPNTIKKYNKSYSGTSCIDLTSKNQNSYPSLIVPTLSFSQSFTIECFIYPTNIEQTLLSFSDLSNTLNANMIVMGYGNYLAQFNNFSFLWYQQAFSSGLININSWNHIAISFNSTGNILYNAINGTVTNNSGTSYGAIPVTNVKPINFFWRNDGTSSYTTGYIDSIRVSQSCIYTTTYTVPSPSTVSSWTVSGSTLFVENFESPLVITPGSITNVSVINQSTGSIGITTVTGGSGSYVYNWTVSSGATPIIAQDLTTKINLLAGIYTLNVTDSNNESTSYIYIVDQPWTLSTTKTNVNTGFDGSINLIITGGVVGTYTFVWKSQDVYIGNTQNINNLLAGTYICTVTSNGNTSTITTVINGLNTVLLVYAPLYSNLILTGTLGLTFNNSSGTLGTPSYTTGPRTGMSALTITDGKYLELPFNTTLDYVCNSCYSFGGWFYISSTSDTNGIGTFLSNNGNGIAGLELYINQNFTQAGVGIWRSDTTRFVDCENVTQPITNVKNSWQHWWVISNGLNISVYRNGLLHSTNIIPSAVYFISNNGWRICNTRRITSSFVGKISDIRWYSGIKSPLEVMNSLFITGTITNASTITSTDGSIASVVVSGGSGSYVYNWTKTGSNYVSTTANISNLSYGEYILVVTDSNGLYNNYIANISYTNLILTGGANWNINTKLLRSSAQSYSGAKSLDITSIAPIQNYYPSILVPTLSYAKDFTIEFFVYSTTGFSALMYIDNNQTDGSQFYIDFQGNTLYYYREWYYPYNTTNSSNLNTNAWNHIAISYRAASGFLFNAINGTVVSTNVGGFVVSGIAPITILNRSDSNQPTKGYIDNLRISQTALYTANYTVPTPSIVLSTWSLGGNTLCYENFESNINITPGTITHVNTFNQPTGSIGQTAISGNTGNYTVSWTSSIGATTITSQDLTAKSNLLPGSYIITVTNDNNDVSIPYIYVVTNPISATFTKTDATTGLNGSITNTSVIGGIGIYTYLYTSQGITIGTTQNLINLVSGIYTCTITSGPRTLTTTITLYGTSTTLLSQILLNNDMSINNSINLSFVNLATTYGTNFIFDTGPQTNLQALVFNLNQYLELPYRSPINYSYSSPFSFGCWVYQTSTAGNVYPMNNNYVSPTSGLELEIYSNAQNVDVGGYTNGGRPFAAGTGAGTLNGLNRWCHYWVTYNGTTLYLFVNGILDSSTAVGTNTFTSNSGWRIFGGKSGNFAGKIFDIRWYSGFKSPLEVIGPINITITYTHTSSISATDGTISIVTTGGTGIYTYSWTKAGSAYSSTSQNISNLLYGDYTVTITDDEGSKSSFTCSVAYPLNIVSNISNSTTYTPGSIILTVTGGQQIKSYSWTVNGTVFSTLKDLYDLGAGTYICTVKSNTLTASITCVVTGVSIGGVWNMDITNLKSNAKSYTGDNALNITNLVQSQTTYPSIIIPSLSFSSDFTIEMFIYPFNTNQTMFSFSDVAGVLNTNLIAMGYGNALYEQIDPFLPWYYKNVANSSAFNANAWNHIAMCYSATTGILYNAINGSVANNTYYKFDPIPVTGVKPINLFWKNDTLASYTTGYIDGIRISQSVIYTSNYTVPTPSTVSSWTLGGTTLYVENFNTILITPGTITHASTYLGNDGSIANTTIVGNIGTTTYSWTSSFNASIITTQDLSAKTNLNAGLYTLTVTDSLNRMATYKFEVGEPITLSPTIIDSTNGANGSIYLNVIGGTVTKKYSTTLNNIVISNSFYIYNIGAGSYICTITCGSLSSTITVVVSGTAYITGGGIWKNLELPSIKSSVTVFTSPSSLNNYKLAQNQSSYPSVFVPTLSFQQDFTIEMFYYPTEGVQTVFHISDARVQDKDNILWNNNQLLLMRGTTQYSLTGGNNVNTNYWNHVAISFKASTNTLYKAVNGSVVSMSNGSITITGPKNINLLWRDDYNGQYCRGFIDNLRVSQSCIYTTNYTTPTTTNVSSWAYGGTTLFYENFNYSLLNGGEWSRNITNLITSNNSYSGFDKSLDVTSLVQSLTTYPSVVVPLLSFSQNFTIEFFMYPTTSAQTYFSIFDADVPNNKGIAFNANNLYFWDTNNSQTNFAINTSPIINSWNHITLSFDTSTSTVYAGINGIVTSSVKTSPFPFSGVRPLNFMYRSDQSIQYTIGYIDNIRVSQSCIYTNSYTIPTMNNINYWNVGGSTLFVEKFETFYVVPGTITNVAIYNDTTGSISPPSIYGGSAPFTYSWSSSNNATVITTQDLTLKDNLSAGNYTLIVTDYYNITATYIFVVLQPLNITEVHTNSINGRDAYINITVSGGTGTNNYSWTRNNIYFRASQNLSSLGAGTYICTVTSGSYTKTITITITGTAPTAPLSLIARISCNGNILEDVNNLATTIVGSASYTTGPPGITTQSIVLANGNNNYIQLPYVSALDFNGSTSFSHGGWHYATNLPFASWFSANQTGSLGFEIQMSSQYDVEIYTNGRNYVPTQPTILLNQWVHVWATYNSTNRTLTHYVNGTLIGSVVIQNYTFNSGIPWRIGADYRYNPGGGYNGRIADVRWYSAIITPGEAMTAL